MYSVVKAAIYAVGTIYCLVSTWMLECACVATSMIHPLLIHQIHVCSIFFCLFLSSWVALSSPGYKLPRLNTIALNSET
jgi:hypothetical protein